MDFHAKLQATWKRNNSLLSVGLDPDSSKLPDSLKSDNHAFLTFNKAIIDATKDVVCCFKLNTAFYESLGSDGIVQLKLTMEYLLQTCPEVPTIVDAKRGDIANTNEGSVAYVFDYLEADAITISPYLGREANGPYLKRDDKGIFVLCRTSNEGAGEFQDLMVDGKPLYQHVARQVADSWNDGRNCHLVVGATYPEECKAVRDIVGQDMVLLLPGLGAQGGDAEASVRSAVNADREGVIINSSRSVIFASSGADFAEQSRAKAIELNEMINAYRKGANNG